MTFAICLANRGTFLGSLFDAARKELAKALSTQGHKALMLPEESTRHDAVGSPNEGRVYAEFLAAHRGEYDGVVLSLPNFGDENGAVVALKDARVPILVTGVSRRDWLKFADTYYGELNHYGMYWLKWADVRR